MMAAPVCRPGRLAREQSDEETENSLREMGRELLAQLHNPMHQFHANPKQWPTHHLLPANLDAEPAFFAPWELSEKAGVSHSGIQAGQPPREMGDGLWLLHRYAIRCEETKPGHTYYSKDCISHARRRVYKYKLAYIHQPNQGPPNAVSSIAHLFKEQEKRNDVTYVCCHALVYWAFSPAILGRKQSGLQASNPAAAPGPASVPAAPPLPPLPASVLLEQTADRADHLAKRARLGPQHALPYLNTNARATWCDALGACQGPSGLVEHHGFGQSSSAAAQPIHPTACSAHQSQVVQQTEDVDILSGLLDFNDLPTEELLLASHNFPLVASGPALAGSPIAATTYSQSAVFPTTEHACQTGVQPPYQLPGPFVGVEGLSRQISTAMSQGEMQTLLDLHSLSVDGISNLPMLSATQHSARYTQQTPPPGDAAAAAMVWTSRNGTSLSVAEASGWPGGPGSEIAAQPQAADLPDACRSQAASAFPSLQGSPPAFSDQALDYTQDECDLIAMLDEYLSLSQEELSQHLLLAIHPPPAQLQHLSQQLVQDPGAVIQQYCQGIEHALKAVPSWSMFRKLKLPNKTMLLEALAMRQGQHDSPQGDAAQGQGQGNARQEGSDGLVVVVAHGQTCSGASATLQQDASGMAAVGRQQGLGQSAAGQGMGQDWQPGVGAFQSRPAKPNLQSGPVHWAVTPCLAALYDIDVTPPAPRWPGPRPGAEAMQSVTAARAAMECQQELGRAAAAPSSLPMSLATPVRLASPGAPGLTCEATLDGILPTVFQLAALATIRAYTAGKGKSFDELLQSRDISSATALHAACKYCDAAVVSWLCGAPPTYGQEPLAGALSILGLLYPATHIDLWRCHKPSRKLLLSLTYHMWLPSHCATAPQDRSELSSGMQSACIYLEAVNLELKGDRLKFETCCFYLTNKHWHERGGDAALSQVLLFMRHPLPSTKHFEAYERQRNMQLLIEEAEIESEAT